MKNQSEIKSLEKSVNEFLKNRKADIESNTDSNSKWRTYYYLSFFFLFFAFIRFIIITQFIKGLDFDEIDYVKEFAYLLGAISINRLAFNIQRKIHNIDEIDYDKWHWKRGRKIFFFASLLFLAIGINLLIRPTVESSIKSNLTVACTVSFFTFIFCIILIARRPLRIINSTIRACLEI